MKTIPAKTWWKESILYQIYPRSFMDSNGDGIGDLEGIIQRLDHLAFLGVDMIWLCPVYDSPNDDNGYDIRDYRAIGSEFGSMDTFDRLLKGVHDRGMRLIMDLVLNHTSDEHAWFKASSASPNNPYRDYYFWQKGVNGGPPNNWPSFFAGNAWTYDPHTDAWFLHLFSQKQPDLNWENPEVRAALYEVVNFWLDKGVDGFRLDVIPLISKRTDFPDTALDRFGDIVRSVYSNGPRVHEYIRELRAHTFARKDAVTVGEGPGITPQTGPDYVNSDRAELDMIFHLDHMFLGYGPGGRFDPVPFTLLDIKRIVRQWDQAIGHNGWISIFMDNHDFPRMVSRFGNDGPFRRQSACLLATMILTLRGTPCIYQGSEIAMANITFDRIEDFDDVETRNFYQQMRAQGMSDAAFIALANQYGRDNARTPMQWSAAPNAGFTTGAPWLTVNPDYREWNVEDAMADPDSTLHFYRNMIAFRKANPLLTYGHYEDLDPDHPQVFAYKRYDEDRTMVVLLNCSDVPVDYKSPLALGDTLISNYSLQPYSGVLHPWHALIINAR
jgi:oligo-1,6-glucosidase